MKQWPKVKHPGLEDEEAERRLKVLVDEAGGIENVTLERAIEEVGYWHTMTILWKWDREKVTHGDYLEANPPKE